MSKIEMMGSQGTPKEIKKAEEMMTKKEQQMSDKREDRYFEKQEKIEEKEEEKRIMELEKQEKQRELKKLHREMIKVKEYIPLSDEIIAILLDTKKFKKYVDDGLEINIKLPKGGISISAVKSSYPMNDPRYNKEGHNHRLEVGIGGSGVDEDVMPDVRPKDVEEIEGFQKGSLPRLDNVQYFSGAWYKTVYPNKLPRNT